MTLPTWLRVAYYALLVLGAVAGWTFILRYVTTYRWWSTELGRHLVTFSGCLAAFETYYFAALIWPHFPGKEFLRAVLFLILTAAVLWRLVMFERLHRHNRDKGITK
jgi:hypothetical protein